MFSTRYFSIPKTSDRIFGVVINRCHSNKSKKISSSLDYCVNLVRKLDRENFFCTLLLPSTIRATAFAIRAFNIEMSKLQENVTEAHIAPFRINFWEDSINKVYEGKPPNHPVLKELYYATKRHKLSKLHFKRLITSRAKQMNSTTFKTMFDMETYADQTTTPVLMLLLEASSVKDIKCDHAASHLGKAQGLCNLIRGLPGNINDKLLLLPRDELAKRKISEESIYRGTFEREPLCDVIHFIAGIAHGHLDMVYDLEGSIPSGCKSIFLPAVAIKSYLKRVQKIDFDILESTYVKNSSLLPLRLCFSKWTNNLL